MVTASVQLNGLVNAASISDLPKMSRWGSSGRCGATLVEKRIL